VVVSFEGSLEITSGIGRGKDFRAPTQQQLEWTTADQVHWIEPDARRAAKFALSINNMFTVHGREV
jgi:hypothetical protein